jgi:hypothetical protein
MWSTQTWIIKRHPGGLVGTANVTLFPDLGFDAP